MADWSKPLPAEAVEGGETHIEDHNALVGALQEVRTNVDGVQEAAEAAQASADSKQAKGNYATSAELSSLDEAKQEKGDYATSSALSALAARVQALEDAADPEPAG